MHEKRQNDTDDDLCNYPLRTEILASTHGILAPTNGILVSSTGFHHLPMGFLWRDVDGVLLAGDRINKYMPLLPPSGRTCFNSCYITPPTKNGCGCEWCWRCDWGEGGCGHKKQLPSPEKVRHFKHLSQNLTTFLIIFSFLSGCPPHPPLQLKINLNSVGLVVQLLPLTGCGGGSGSGALVGDGGAYTDEK